jgi:pimeloyl-ACP methyl ester carboxylesterase
MSVTSRVPGLVLEEHEFEVPLRHVEPDGPRIKVFAREISAPDGHDKPYLVYLQGGPGVEAPRPTVHPWSPGWLERALADYRVLMLDQRGTGRSTPVGELAESADQTADYLRCFRADSIVDDAEWIRHELGVDKWSVLGQSFGGFCALRYMSAFPEGLAEAYFTGGLPPVGRTPDEVYLATYKRTLEKNDAYYTRYPQDRSRVLELHDTIRETEIVLPGGDHLTERMLRQLGWMLGMSDGAEHLHYILELPHGSPAFLHDLERGLPPVSRNPLYAAIHESSYADGGPTAWSASRVRPADFDESPELFTGEHVFPWMFEDYRALRPLAQAAALLAALEWPRLYDPERLRSCGVPASALVYANDMYVERCFSEETARMIPTMKIWLTSEYEHNGLRVDGGRILDRLIEMAKR